MSLNPKAARDLLEKLDGAASADDVHAHGGQLLNLLLKQLEDLRVLANGYPRNPISAEVWTDGKALAELCDELTGVLQAKGYPHEAELASRLATGMACQVMGHYPEEIFPRVLRNSRCREAIDNLDDAIGGYEAIVGDFEALELNYLLDEAEPLEEAGHVILAAVHEAIGRLNELHPERAPALAPLSAALSQRLAAGC